MALSQQGSSPEAPVARAVIARWPLGLFVLGLLAEFVGMRLLGAADRGLRLGLVYGGLTLVALATGARFLASRREPRATGRLLAGLSLLGLLGALLAYLQNELGPLGGWLLERSTESRERLELSTLVLASILLAASVLSLSLAELALAPMRHAPELEHRRVQAGARSGLLLVLTVAISGLLAFAGGKARAPADFSYFKTSRPSVATLSVARGLSQPVRAIAFFPEISEPREEVLSYLRQLHAQAPKLQVEAHDRVLVPKLARELRVAEDGVLVLARGEMRQVIQIGTEMNAARHVLRTLDSEVQKQLRKLIQPQRIAYLTVGHGELNDSKRLGGTSNRGVTLLKKLLELQNYRVLELGLADGLARDVPADAHVVLVLGPTESFAPAELEALRRFTARGGRSFIALEPELRVNTGAEGLAARNQLDSWLGDLGLSFEGTPIASEREFVEKSFNKSDRVQLLVNRFSSHPSVATLRKNNAWVVLFGTGALRRLNPLDRQLDPVLQTRPDAFQDTNGNYEPNPGEPRRAFELAVAVIRPLAAVGTHAAPAAVPSGSAQPAEAPKDSRSYVIGDTDAFSDIGLRFVPTNRVLLLDALRWLGGEESLAGAETGEEDVRIQHTRASETSWFYALLFGVPGSVLGLWWLLNRRQRRGAR